MVRYFVLFLLFAVLQPALIHAEDVDNDGGYRAPVRAETLGNGEVEEETKPSKYKERITIQKAPGAKYEKIIVTPPPQPRAMPKPAIMPEATKPSGGNARWKKYDDMTISPSEVGSPGDLFLLPPN